MTTRQLSVLLLAGLTAACASDRPSHLGMSNLGAGELAAVAAVAPPAKTMSSRVLAAIALETVTGRRPDPGRLAEGR